MISNLCPDTIMVICEYLSSGKNILNLSECSTYLYSIIMDKSFRVSDKTGFKLCRYIVPNLEWMQSQKHLLKNLDISHNQFITSDFFKLIEGITIVLDISGYQKITDNEFRYLSSVRDLFMVNCSQKDLTNEAFKYLINLEYVDLCYCKQFSDKILDYLPKLKCIRAFCSNGFLYTKHAKLFEDKIDFCM